LADIAPSDVFVKGLDDIVCPLHAVESLNLVILMILPPSKTLVMIIFTQRQGLDRTKAGREAMMRIEGSLVPRKDMFTSEQLGRATALAVGGA